MLQLGSRNLLQLSDAGSDTWDTAVSPINPDSGVRNKDSDNTYFDEENQTWGKPQPRCNTEAFMV
jgi:hypothetical protein